MEFSKQFTAEWFCSALVYDQLLLLAYLLWIPPMSMSDAASGWAGWALAQPEFGSSVTLLQPGGQIMPTTLLLPHPDLKTQRHLWLICFLIYAYLNILAQSQILGTVSRSHPSSRNHDNNKRNRNSWNKGFRIGCWIPCSVFSSKYYPLQIL